MLNCKFIRTGVAGMVTLFAAAMSGNALGQPFANGDVITHTQANWGNPASTGGQLLSANYNTVFAPSFEIEVGIPGSTGFSMVFSSSNNVFNYLPAIGNIGALIVDATNPTHTASGIFGGDVLALRLSVAFSDAGLTVGRPGVPLGDLELSNLTNTPLLNGLSVRQFSDEMNTLLGGGSGLYDIFDVEPIIDGVVQSFSEGIPSQWAQDHLRVVTEPVFNSPFVTHTQASWGDEVVTPTNPAGVLQANYNTVYAATGGVFFVGRGGIHYGMQFTNAGSLLSYLPAFGLDGRLTADHLNPLTTNAGGFGGEVSALKLNIDFSDAGVTQGDVGTRFGDLVLFGLTDTNQPQFNGFSVRQFFASASSSLGTAVAGDVSHFNAITEELNAAFAGIGATDWARDHLRIAIAGDYNANVKVDAADYVAWRKFENTTLTLPNDATPGTSPADYNLWRQRFGMTSASSGAAPPAGVPEPATALLMMIAAVGWCLQRGQAA